ncbi:kinase-like domain-containing protein [Mycena epipterygia]|nr:kinase-like domain-containing protein [Mycena epipterygia]
MRHFLRGPELHRIRLKFCREALVWRDLHHPNILPFIGIDRESFPSSLSMVSPWMEHGTILKYLDVHGRANVDKLLFEIAQGLQYLHSRNIVHGDLRGANILINEDWSACLTDFGLSVFSNATSSMCTSTRAGSLYWMAPELIDPARFGCRFVRTPASDVYAFGCVCIEVYTGRPPFSELSEPAALLSTLNGERPGRPSGTPAMSDLLWQNVTVYWAQEPTARPITEVVVQNMTWPVVQKPLPPLPEMPSVPSGNDTSSILLHTPEPVQPVQQLNPIPNSPVESPLENNLLREKRKNKNFWGREHTDDDHLEVAERFTLQWRAPGGIKTLFGRDKPKV